MEEEMVKEIPFHSLIVGATKSGKTKYLIDLLRGPFKQVFHYIILICPTFAINKTWKKFSGINDERFYVMSPNVCENEEIEKCLKICHDLFYDNEEYQVLVILDDCAVSQDVKKRSSKLVDLAYSGRHVGISVWVLTQQLTSITKPFRENVSLIVSFKSKNRDANDMLFREYGEDVDKNDIDNIKKILKENKYSRICFFLNEYEVQIPNVTI